MRSLRSLVDFALRRLLDGTSDVSARRIDAAIFKTVGSLLKACGIPYAELVEEEYVLDTIYLLVQSILETPYGAPLRFHWPLVVSITATDKCPFHCAYCYSNSSALLNASISLSLVERLSATPIPNFMLTGGEPMAARNLPQVMSTLLSAHKHVYLSTNAPAAATKPLQPLIRDFRHQIIFVVSLWGEPALHDSLRGAGNFSQTIELINHLSSVGAYCWLNCVIADPHFTSLDVFRYVNGRKLDGILVSRIIQKGRSAHRPLVWNDELVAQLMAKRRLVERELGKNLFVDIPEAASLWSRPNWRSSLLSTIGIYLPAMCSSGVWTMHVDSSGECYPCFAFEPEHSFGNISDTPIQEIWRSIQRHSQTRRTSNACWAE